MGINRYITYINLACALFCYC